MLPNLQYFDGSKNKVSALPKSIGRVKNLTYLNFNNNELFGLPPQIGLLEKLRIMDLWSNELSDFPESMKMMKSLIVLDLRAILMDETMQKRLKELMPNTTIHMSPSCNCKLN
jgi:Leucine-rich repeat (LRR) protein